MVELEWCKNQPHGIKKVEPSENVAKEYLENAEESLRILKHVEDTGSRIWLATIRYYIEYFAVYAVLMRLGLKSEIHGCTIEISKWLRDRGVIQGEHVKQLERSKDLRIKNQYNLKDRPVNVDEERLKDFILDMREIVESLSDEEVNSIRGGVFS